MSRVITREALVEALIGNGDTHDVVDVINETLEIAAAEAEAIFDLGEGATDPRTLVARGLSARLQGLRTFVLGVDWDAELGPAAARKAAP